MQLFLTAKTDIHSTKEMHVLESIGNNLTLDVEKGCNSFINKSPFFLYYIHSCSIVWYVTMYTIFSLQHNGHSAVK